MCEGLILPLGSFLSNMSPGDRVDLVCVLIALVSIGLGAHRGLSSEMPLGVGWFCGILSAWYAYAPLHTFLSDLSFMHGEPEFLFLLSALTVILLSWGVAIVVSRGLRLLAVHFEKTPLDYILGTVVGICRAFVILLIVTAIMLCEAWWPDGRKVFCEQSRTGKTFTPWSSGLIDTVNKLFPHIEIHRRTDDPGDISGAPPKSAR